MVVGDVGVEGEGAEAGKGGVGACEELEHARNTVLRPLVIDCVATVVRCDPARREGLQRYAGCYRGGRGGMHY